ncbi:hypothetical protein HY994_03325 [Candidatus Micrarchaeota archaeon]|nr:hypothetical protein [Candidatus Micrarchaeota archaeon]
MSDHANAYRMAAALILTAGVIYFGIPTFMGIPPFADFADLFILHTTQPLVTGLTLGASFGIIAAIAYSFFSIIKQIA